MSSINSIQAILSKKADAQVEIEKKIALDLVSNNSFLNRIVVNGNSLYNLITCKEEGRKAFAELKEIYEKTITETFLKKVGDLNDLFEIKK